MPQSSTTSTAIPASASTSERLYFLDWVRIIAFFLLIFYHVGMYYVGEDWHVNSPHVIDMIKPLMLLSSPWRLSLLFLVSGVASAFMLHKHSAAKFARQRSGRLLPPLLFGMLIIVPPQTYFEVIEKLAYPGSYLDFMKLYLSGYSGFCKDGCLILPTWNHLWFVAYLWAYSLVLAVFMALRANWFSRLRAVLINQLRGWRIIVLPILYLALIRVAMLNHFPTTHALIDDWFNHANYLFFFLFGALIAPSDRFWQELVRLRWPSLLSALAAWIFLVSYYAYFNNVHPAPDWLRLMQRGIWVILEWTAILAACGFARLHLQKDHAARRYLTVAIFPVYIFHQTIIVMLAHALKPYQLAAPAEACLLIVATLILSFSGYEIVKRHALLRPLFGLGKLNSKTSL
ncbi:acyltransferase [Undibacterium sp.]|uniref:acyltransferase family protein n=1 Tax=Undibacterium sp. TaxID=1914977 RepID=UPI0025E5BD11|nr:acyltransferase [Undibacterium sp.]